MTATDLQEYVNANPGEDEAFVAECWEQAQALVDAFVRNAKVPKPVLKLAYLQVGSELYHRRNAPSGIGQFATLDGGPVAPRLARDPLTPVYPVLRRYVGGGFA